MKTKTQVKHTPGPWFVNLEPGVYGDVYVEMDGQREFIAVKPSSIKPNSAQGRSWEKMDQWKFNARLIAAAPEMLEFLKEEYSFLSNCKPSSSYERRLKALIAKAEGRS